jgi:hypothetical protein
LQNQKIYSLRGQGQFAKEKNVILDLFNPEPFIDENFQSGVKDMNRKLTLGVSALFALFFAYSAAAEAYPGYCGNYRHPYRHEVTRRDNRLRSELRYDRGRLGGNYGRLMAEDNAIRRQEQRDLRMNGGYLTRGEYRGLNREENSLQRQINRDYRPY